MSALDAARRIWVSSVGDADDGSDVATTASQLLARLNEGLTRWIGAEGYKGVLERALGQSREAHPWTSSLDSAINQDRVLRASTSNLGSAATIDGIVAVLAAIIELLGRIVGDVVAARLVEQAGVPTSRGFADKKTEQKTDDQ